MQLEHKGQVIKEKNHFGEHREATSKQQKVETTRTIKPQESQVNRGLVLGAARVPLEPRGILQVGG